MKPRTVDTWDCWNEKPGQVILYHGACHVSVNAGEQGVRLAAINCPKETEVERLRRLLRCCVGFVTGSGPLPSSEEVKQIIQAAEAAGG